MSPVRTPSCPKTRSTPPLVRPRPGGSNSGGRRDVRVDAPKRSCWPASAPREQHVAKTLMVSLAVVVKEVFPNRPPKMGLPERDDSIEAFALDGQDESLRIGVQVWAPRRQKQ